MDEKRLVRLLWIVKTSLLAVLLYVGFGVVTGRLHLDAMLDPGTASGEQYAPGAEATLPQTRSPSDYGAIADRNPFAQAAHAGDARTASDHSRALDSMRSAEELGLRLVGAIAGGPVASRAIIQNTGTNATGSYKIGDTIASATVQAIQREAVILRYQDQPLVLKLRAGTPENGGQKLQEAGQKAQDGGPRTGGRNQPSPVIDPAPARAGTMTEVFRKAVIEPYMRNGRTEGLRISGLENIPVAGMLGLKSGDIVQSINGQQLASKQKAFQVLMKARTQSKINLQLLRDGQRKDLSFDL